MAKRRKKRDENGTPVETIGGSIDQVVNGAQANGNGHANGHADLPHVRFSDEACEEILAARRTLQDTLDDMNAAKRELREKRAAFETATENLTRTIDEARQPTLFNRDGKPKTNGEAVPPEVEGKPLSSFTPPNTDETWRPESIRVLVEHGLPDHIAQKLVDGGITTLGELQDYTDPTKNGGYQKNITDIDQIGAVAAEKIADAFVAYLAKRPAPAAAPEVPAADVTAPEAATEANGVTPPDPAILEPRDSIGFLNAEGERTCRVCKCTAANCEQCVEAIGEPCSWSEKDPTVCTRCEIEGADKPAKPKRAAKSRGEKKARRKKEAAHA